MNRYSIILGKKPPNKMKVTKKKLLKRKQSEMFYSFTMDPTNVLGDPKKIIRDVA
jgi:hypothetical protein